MDQNDTDGDGDTDVNAVNFGFPGSIVPEGANDTTTEIIAVVKILTGNGTIEPSLFNPLRARLEQARARYAEGNSTAGDNVMNAVRNQVNAAIQSGRITGQAAKLLFEMINNVQQTNDDTL